MLRKILAAIFFYSLLIPSLSSAQDYEVSGESPKLPSVGAGFGILSFFGDVGRDKQLTAYSNFRAGYGIFIEQKFFNTIGVTGTFLSGKVAKNERSTIRSVNFESKLMAVGVGLRFHFSNGFLLPSNIRFGPFLSGGLHYLSFKPFSDLKDRNGVVYNYWADGSIRSLPETDPKATSASYLQRDYTYETDLHALKTDSIDYKLTTLSYPVGGGAIFRLTNFLHVTIGANYYFTATDWIDDFSHEGKGNRQGGTGNDGFLQTYMNISYQFGTGEGGGGTKTPKDTRYDNVDFTSIDKADSDGDKVKDILDNCPNTPAGVKVDSDGCPLDTDNDGVPDYLDKEPKTAAGVIVDANGVELKDAPIEQYEASKRLPETEKPGGTGTTTTTNTKPGETTTAPGAGKLPTEFKTVDTNNDGMISSDEIGAAIDNFFEGNSAMTVELIYRLIDYFFEQ